MGHSGKRRSPLWACWLAALAICLAVCGQMPRAGAAPALSYRVHVQDIGWMPPVQGGEIAGTTGQSRQMEAIAIALEGGGIRYCAHLQDIGWQRPVRSGEVAGTTGQGRRMEAIRIALDGQAAQSYDIYYRAHVANLGWLGWARNGEPAGTAGAHLRMEAIQIRLVERGASFVRGGPAFCQKAPRSRNAAPPTV